MMNDTNDDVQDEPSLSGISFPSLNLMYSHEENDIIPPNDTTIDDTSSDTDNDNLDQTKVTPTDITKQILSNSEGQTMMDHFMVTNSNEYDDYDDYPTDENTLGSLDGKKVSLNLWQLAKKHLLIKKEPVAGTPTRSNISTEIPHINVINESHTVDDIDDGDSFLGNVKCTNVENSSTLDKDDTSFLESATVQDAPTLKSVNEEVGDNDVESYYNIHASTLSRASASTKIGDQLLKESYMASKLARNDDINLLADNQSNTTSKYSYKRAFENVTLGGSSTYDCSALTEDYCYDAQRIGLGLPTERLDMTQVNYNEDTEHSTPNRSSDIIDETDPNHNNEHLTRVLSYVGEVEGYVDEETARKYSPAQSRKGSSCCTWFSSSTRFAKLIVVCSLILLFVSVASVSLALLMPEDEGEISSAETIASSSTLVNSTDEFDQEVDMTVVDNDPTNQMNSSNTISPSIKSVPSVMPSTLTPSKSPQAVIYSTSEVIDSSTDAPVLSPSFKPSTKAPTRTPSNEPTTLSPSQIPTESQIITNNPTLKPITSSPTSKAPTTTIQTLPEIVTIQSSQETYIDSSDSDENFGTSNRLRVDGSPRRWTLIEFPINNSIQRQSQTVNLRVIEAKLRLYPTDSGGSSTVYAVPSSIQWSETSVTWNNFADVLDASEEVEVASIGGVNSYQWKEVDVSSAFASSLTDISDTITFVIKSRSTNGVSYRAGPFSPRLELTVGSDDVVTESPSPMPTTTTQGNTPYPTYTPTVRVMRSASPSPEPSRRTRAPHKRPLPTENV